MDFCLFVTEFFTASRGLEPSSQSVSLLYSRMRSALGHRARRERRWLKPGNGEKSTFPFGSLAVMSRPKSLRLPLRRTSSCWERRVSFGAHFANRAGHVWQFFPAVMSPSWSLSTAPASHLLTECPSKLNCAVLFVP